MRFQPDGWMKRGLAALLLLLAIAFGVHLAYEFLAPLLPEVIVLVVLGVLYTVVFGRRY
jgi:CBS-domain-containing membrane protein